MPRERSFSEPEVIDRMADLFATHGYGGTSMAMLQEATGLGKQSLYNAFGDKAALYRQAVDSAVGRFARVLPQMQAAPNGRMALQRFFAQLSEDCRSGDSVQRACIVTNGLMEDLGDEAMHAQLEQKWLATHELLREQVERGQRDGSIASRLPSAQLADQLMLAASGLRVMARVRGAAGRIESSMANTLALLDVP